jgi:hypothetical protein
MVGIVEDEGISNLNAKPLSLVPMPISTSVVFLPLHIYDTIFGGHGEPGLRCEIRKRLLSTGQIWQGRVYSRPRGRDFAVVPFFEGETDGFETN